MKYLICPTCEWTLGVPDKLSDHPVTCPKCGKVFLASPDLMTDEAPVPPPSKTSKQKKKSKKKTKPSLRSMPVPSALSTVSEIEQKAEEAVSSEDGATMTGAKSRNRIKELDAPVPKRRESVKEESKAVSTPKKSKIKSEEKVVARIIDAAPEEDVFDEEGELPTLQLKENEKQKVDTEKIKSNPVFLGVLICVSIVTSALLVVVSQMQTSASERRLDEARQEIKRFYKQMREDVPLRPYQLELREAQLAHSRNDRRAEVAAYRKTMARFRSEDKDPAYGVTGSIGSDAELEQLLSILIGGG